VSRPNLPPKPRVLLLDAGNTLVFLDVDEVARIIAEQGYAISSELLRRAQRPATRAYEELVHSGRVHEDAWHVFMAELLCAAGIARGQAESLVPALRAAHDRFNLWRHVPRGVHEALRRAEGLGIRLGVISNSEGQLASLFDRLGLSSRFSVLLDSGVEGIAKPDPKLFARALEQLGESPDRAVYAGDIPGVDVRGARAAGIPPVLVDALGQYPDYAEAPRVESLGELIDAWHVG
jgi:putative hydrolase of the HAD superfamily